MTSGATAIPIELLVPPIICRCKAVVFPIWQTARYRLSTTCSTVAAIPITKDPIRKIKNPREIWFPSMEIRTGV